MISSNKTICCIFDQAAHYRAPIYKLIDQNLNCDFYITKWETDPFKQMNYEDLKGLKKISKNKYLFGKYFWQKSTLQLAFRSYKKYLMIGNPYSVSTWIILIILKLRRKKAFLWAHGWYGRESRLKVFVKKVFFLLASKTFLYGNYAKKLMIKEGIPKKKLTCIYNSLDYREQIIIRKELRPSQIYTNHFRNSNPTLIYIGRIQKIKKLDLLIKAVALLKKQGRECNLVIIGKEIEDIGLIDIITGSRIHNNVWLFGECYKESKIAELIFNADICVSPGNVGLTAIHSLTYGTPVITHDNFKNQMPEFEAIQENRTGSFFKEDSVEDLAIKIENWLRSNHEHRATIRRACFEIIDDCYNPNVQLEILKNEIV